MKKILFFVGNLNLSGGTERVATTVANALVDKGYAVTFINLVDGQEPFFTLDGRIDNVFLFSEKISFIKNYHKVVYRLRQTIKKHQADVFIDVESMLAMFSCIALLGLGIRHICWEHFQFKIDLGKKPRRLARQMALVMADDIVVLTQKDERFWQQGAWWRRAQIRQIYNPSPFPVSQHQPPLNNKIFLAVGRYTQQKGFDLLIQAWALVKEQLNDWQLLIVGEGEDRVMLEKLISQNGLKNNILLTGRTDDVESYYKQASYYVLSSRFEGFVMTILEAQSFGVPVIAFDCDCGPNEIITNQSNGFLCAALDVEALSQLLVSAKNIDPTDYLNLCLQAKNKVNTFALDVIISQWVRLLDEK